ncbi:MAG: amidase [Hyphomicrobiales bacterium]|nr:amidase [Hyphomicrobiales bacterium]
MSSTAGLTKLSAVELARRIKAGEITPLEVLEAHLAKIEELNPQLNAIVTLDIEGARAQAIAAGEAVKRGDKLGPLHGLPVVIKDVTLTKGMRTTYASPLYRDFIPDVDAAPVARLRKAGAIILGKTNTPEFATGATTFNDVFGVTRNPWDPTKTPAGSSGGSAAAAASGMSPLAHGTDFGCSVRMPAAFCGIVGIRTTAGLIPNDPMHLPWDPGQVHGPLARSAEDAALMLDAMVGLDPTWPISAAPPWASALDIVNATADAKGLRIAYVSDIAGFGVDDEIDAICRAAAMKLADDGAQVDEIKLDLTDGFAAYKTLRGEWMVGQQIERLDFIDQFGANLSGNVKAGLALSVLDTAKAELVREQMWAKFRAFFADYDFLITPCSPVAPFSVDEKFPTEINGRKLDNYIDWIAPCFLITLVGFPAGSAPAGLTASGLPVGIQIVGKRFDEPQILGLCKLVQRANPIGWPKLS